MIGRARRNMPQPQQTPPSKRDALACLPAAGGRFRNRVELFSALENQATADVTRRTPPPLDHVRQRPRVRPLPPAGRKPWCCTILCETGLPTPARHERKYPWSDPSVFFPREPTFEQSPMTKSARSRNHCTIARAPASAIIGRPTRFSLVFPGLIPLRPRRWQSIGEDATIGA